MQIGLESERASVVTPKPYMWIFTFPSTAHYQELAPFEALDATRIAVAIIVILISGFCRFGRLR